MKTVVVTGGTVRIGKAISETLRARGWRVLTTSHRRDSGADVVADLSEPSGAARLYAAVLNRLGGEPPDALVNNAALFVGEPSAVEAVGFLSPKKLTTLMAGREDGVAAVVNVLDARLLSDADDGSATSAASGYRETKRRLRDFTTWAAETFAATLRVNAVAPGPVSVPVGLHEPAGEMLLDRRPTMEDVAEAVAYLLEARSVTGCVIPVDAGQHLLAE